MVKKVNDDRVVDVVNTITKILQEPGLRVSPKLRTEIPRALDLLVELSGIKAVNTTIPPAAQTRKRLPPKENAALKTKLQTLEKLMAEVKSQINS